MVCFFLKNNYTVHFFFKLSTVEMLFSVEKQIQISLSARAIR